jgi:hypothetical protein
VSKNTWEWHAFDGLTEGGNGTFTFADTSLLLTGVEPTLCTFSLDNITQIIALAFDGSYGGNARTQYPMASTTNFQTQDGSRLACVLSPFGGEVWGSGSTHIIEWEGDRAEVFFSIDKGKTWEQIGTGIVTGTSLEWDIPPVANRLTKCLVKVVGYDIWDNDLGTDISDKVFTIDVVETTSPNGGESIVTTNDYTITWITSPLVDSVHKVKLY